MGGAGGERHLLTVVITESYEVHCIRVHVDLSPSTRLC